MTDVFSTLIQSGDKVVAIVGAGGKTALMFCLAAGFVGQGNRVITTTTTRILVPESQQSPRVVLAEDADFPATLHHGLTSCNHVTVGRQVLAANKLQGLSPAELKCIVDHAPVDRLIVEADGARGLSLKAPGAREPVVPFDTDLFIVLVGLDIIGQRLSNNHVFRPERVAALTGSALGDVITPQIIGRLITHPEGLRKGCPETARCCIFLNKAETPDRLACSSEIISATKRLFWPTTCIFATGSILNDKAEILG